MIIRNTKEYIFLSTNRSCQKIGIIQCFLQESNRDVSQCILSDVGLKYTNQDFKGLLKKMRVEFCYSTPYIPPPNGTADRINWTLVDLTWDEWMNLFTNPANEYT